MRPTRRHVLGFLAFSHGWTWLFWLLAGLSGDSIWEMPGVIFFYVGGAGVLLGGIAMSGVTYGVAGLRDLGRRIVDPRRIAWRWWAAIVLLFPAITVTAAAIAVAAGVSADPLDLSGAAERMRQPAQLLVFVVFILIIGPLPEEVGWRGYLLDRLQLRWNALAASLLIAAIWWTWHLPLLVLPGYFDAFVGVDAPSPLTFLYGIVPSAVLYTWVYNNTDRSVLAVIVVHFMQNFSSQFLGIAQAVRPIQLLLVAATAIAVVLWWGPATMRRGQPVPRPLEHPPAESPRSVPV